MELTEAFRNPEKLFTEEELEKTINSPACFYNNFIRIERGREYTDEEYLELRRTRAPFVRRNGSPFCQYPVLPEECFFNPSNQINNNMKQEEEIMVTQPPPQAETAQGSLNETNGLTFGQRLMSVDFNPNGNPEVAQIKQKFAEIADILDLQFMGSINADVATMHIIAGHAMTSLLQAQMAAVKAITAA